jgi:hypothetical protein
VAASNTNLTPLVTGPVIEVSERHASSAADDELGLLEVGDTCSSPGSDSCMPSGGPGPPAAPLQQPPDACFHARISPVAASGLPRASLRPRMGELDIALASSVPSRGGAVIPRPLAALGQQAVNALPCSTWSYLRSASQPALATRTTLAFRPPPAYRCGGSLPGAPIGRRSTGTWSYLRISMSSTQALSTATTKQNTTPGTSQ